MQQTVIPQLRINSAVHSLKFYVEGLGFAVDWEHQFEPGYPLFIQVTRSKTNKGVGSLFLREGEGFRSP